MTRICIVCETPFEPHLRQRICSESCRRKRNVELAIKSRENNNMRRRKSQHLPKQSEANYYLDQLAAAPARNMRILEKYGVSKIITN
jgi:predicted nucleic acid-binding Zn ribbon protein